MSDASPISRAMSAIQGPRRMFLLAAAAIAIVALWGVGRWASTPSYVTLFHDLDLKEAGSVGESLAKTNIPYKLGPSGTEILVPASEVPRARVALAKDGLPTSGRPGLELFDKNAWGMTDFTQRVTYQRALEGELARTIGGLRGIQRAEVHLVMPTPNPIKRLENPASASVVVTLRPGTTLSPETIQGITYIVSNSVEQLSSDNVAVMDDGGRVLSAPAGGLSGGGASVRQLEVQRSVEQYLSERVETLLATVVGTGRTRAQVSALLSFDQVDKTIDQYDPEGAVLQTEQRSETGEGGAETPGAQTIVSNAYQNSRKLERIVGATGSISRLTVTVLVDRDAVTSLATPGEAEPPIARLESMVRNAIGIDSTRGDRMSVMAVKFEPATAAAAGGTAAAKGGAGDAIVVVERVSRPLIGLVAIVALVFVAVQALKAIGSGGGAAPLAAKAEPVEPSATNGVADRGPRSRLKPDVEQKAEATAQVVRAWLAES